MHRGVVECKVVAHPRAEQGRALRLTIWSRRTRHSASHSHSPWRPGGRLTICGRKRCSDREWWGAEARQGPRAQVYRHVVGEVPFPSGRICRAERECANADEGGRARMRRRPMQEPPIVGVPNVPQQRPSGLGVEPRRRQHSRVHEAAGSEVEVGAECVDDAGTAGVTVTKLEAEPALTFCFLGRRPAVKGWPFPADRLEARDACFDGAGSRAAQRVRRPGKRWQGRGFRPRRRSLHSRRMHGRGDADFADPPADDGSDSPGRGGPATAHFQPVARTVECPCECLGIRLWPRLYRQQHVDRGGRGGAGEAGGAVLVIFARRRKAMAS